jgi:hypothetical protein
MSPTLVEPVTVRLLMVAVPVTDRLSIVASPDTFKLLKLALLACIEADDALAAVVPIAAATSFTPGSELLS